MYIKEKWLWLTKYQYDIINQNIAGEISEMTRNDTCFCGSGKKQKNCHADVNNESLYAYIIRQYNSIDSKISDLQKQSNTTPLCKKGCKLCCSDYFYISKVEYFVLRYRMIAIEKLHEYILKAENLMQNLSEKYSEEYNLLHTTDFEGLSKNDIIELIEDDNKMINVGLCPLNNTITGDCEIYLERPYVCRLFGNTMDFGICKLNEKNQRKLFLKKRSLLNCRLYTEQEALYTVFIPSVRNNKEIYEEEYLQYKRLRLMPLFYWLVNDSYFEKDYLAAITLPIKQYLY